MSDFNEKLVSKIAKLEREIERLKALEAGGVWTAYTPTITYAGGSTDPTSESVSYSNYMKIGALVIFIARIYITRGSGDRTITKFSLPKNAFRNLTPISAYSTVTGGATNPTAYIDAVADTAIVNHGTMTSDGYISITAIYEVA